MADRKIRRRTRWTWTRGPEEGYADKDTVPYSDYLWLIHQGKVGVGVAIMSPCI